MKSTKLNLPMLLVITGVCAIGYNTAEAEEEHDSSIAVGFNLTDGNSETSMLTIDLKSERKDDENEFLFGANFSFGETTDQVTDETDTTTEKAKASLQYNRLFSDELYGILKVEGSYDAVADVDYRFIVGPGIGYYLIKDEDTNLGLELGGSWISDKVGGVTDDAFALRVAERFEHKLSETAKVWQSVEYLPEFDDFGTYLLNSEMGGEAAMNASLSLRLVVADTYDSEPAAGRDENDVTVTASLVYKL